MSAAQVGYVITGIKVTRSARVGDTWHLHKRPVERLPGFKPSKSMVFAGAHPWRISGKTEFGYAAGLRVSKEFQGGHHKLVSIVAHGSCKSSLWSASWN